jgi:hypothetical protein
MRTVLLFGIFFAFAWNTDGQTIEELKAQKTALETELAPVSAKANELSGQISALNDQIRKLSGWDFGLNVNLGFEFNQSENWIANPNPTSSSSSMGLGLTLAANKITDKYLWRNKGIWNKAWQDVDIPEEDGTTVEDDLFDQGTVDLLNVSSLFGYNVYKDLAISILGELNSSAGNFLEPGTVDIGVGATWTPIPDLVVVAHPFNYRLAFNGLENADGESSIGAKLRADYNKAVRFGGRSIIFNSTLTSFLPYQDKEDVASLQEVTWLNGISFNVLKGVGVGVNFGLRKADFETTETQNFYSVGLNYAINQ